MNRVKYPGLLLSSGDFTGYKFEPERPYDHCIAGHKNWLIYEFGLFLAGAA